MFPFYGRRLETLIFYDRRKKNGRKNVDCSKRRDNGNVCLRLRESTGSDTMNLQLVSYLEARHTTQNLNT